MYDNTSPQSILATELNNKKYRKNPDCSPMFDAKAMKKIVWEGEDFNNAFLDIQRDEWDSSIIKARKFQGKTNPKFGKDPILWIKFHKIASIRSVGNFWETIQTNHSRQMDGIPLKVYVCTEMPESVRKYCESMWIPYIWHNGIEYEVVFP